MVEQRPFKALVVGSSPTQPTFFESLTQAGVAELADATDSKSVARKGVWVRPPPPAPLNGTIYALQQRLRPLAFFEDRSFVCFQ